MDKFCKCGCGKEDYKKMWDKCLEYKCKYPSCRMHEAIAALDLLGIEKYKKKEKSK